MLLIITVLSMLAMHMGTVAKVLEKRRFDQNNPPILAEIGSLEDVARLGNGQFRGIQGGFSGVLLADSPACSRYALIDELVNVSKANNLPQGVELAKRLASLEKNFNPFSGENAKPSFCNDPALPASPEVRCVVPVIDPAFPGAAQFNTQANSRLDQIVGNAAGNPDLCAGQSVQQQAIALGISGCLGCNITPGSNTASAPVLQPQSPPAVNNNNFASAPAPVPQSPPATNNTQLPSPPPQNPPPTPDNNSGNTSGQCVGGASQIANSATMLQMMDRLNGLVREIESLQNMLRNTTQLRN